MASTNRNAHSTRNPIQPQPEQLQGSLQQKTSLGTLRRASDLTGPTSKRRRSIRSRRAPLRTGSKPPAAHKRELTRPTSPLSRAMGSRRTKTNCTDEPSPPESTPAAASSRSHASARPHGGNGQSSQG